MSLLFVDSGCDLGYDQIKKLGIECVNIPYMINDNVLSFTEEFDYVKFYSKFRKGVVVSSKSLSKQEYIDIFEPAIKSDDVIYIHSSSKIMDIKVLEGVKESLIKKYPNRRMELIDSGNMTIGQGCLSFLLAKMYRNGSTIDEIINAAMVLRKEIALYAVVDSLETLSNHGLIDGNKIAGTALNIKPIIAVDFDGQIQIIDKVSGRKKALNKLIELLRQTGENVVDYPLAIANAHADSDSDYLETKIKEHFGEDIQLFKGKMSPSTTSLLGINAICVSFHVHSKIY